MHHISKEVALAADSDASEFKILLRTHRALNGQAPDNIEDCVSRRQPIRSLRSSEHSLLCMSRTGHQWGDRAFSVAAPSLWNALQQCLNSAVEM